MKRSQGNAAFRIADVQHGTNFDTEITPLHRREFPWVMEYKSPDYSHALRDPDAPNEDVQRDRGFYIDIAQSAVGPEGQGDGAGPCGLVALSGVVYVSAWVAADPRTGDGRDEDLIIDGCGVHLDDLERFASALTAMVALARNQDRASRRGGRAP